MSLYSPLDLRRLGGLPCWRGWPWHCGTWCGAFYQLIMPRGAVKLPLCSTIACGNGECYYGNRKTGNGPVLISCTCSMTISEGKRTSCEIFTCLIYPVSWTPKSHFEPGCLLITLACCASLFGTIYHSKNPSLVNRSYRLIFWWIMGIPSAWLVEVTDLRF